MTFLHVQFTSIAKLSIDKHNHSILDEEIKDVIKSCGFVVKKWLHIKESSENGNKPILSYKIIDVECWYENEKVSKFWMYSVLRRKWSSINKYIFAVVGSHMIPWLTFTEKDAFSNERWPLHQTKSITQLFLGTLAWPSLLISHFKFLDDISCEGYFFHDVKYMEFIFHDYKLKIQYSDIRNILIKDIGTEATVFLDLGCPPLVFSETCTMSKRCKIAWKRIVTFPCLAKHTLGCASILAITFTSTSLCWEIISRMYYRCGKMPIHCVDMTVTEEPLKKIPKIDLDHFGCLYLISGLLLRNYIIRYQCNGYRTFLQEMKRLAEIDSDVLEKVLADVLLETDRGIIFNYNETINQLFEWYRENKNLSNYTQYFLPEKTRLVRRLTVTPTRTLFWPSAITFENRILRKFDPDYALRVSFRDDNQMRLNHSTYIDESVYQSAIEDITRKGIRLGSRYYEFLAWSNSQIRDHAVWFYAKDTEGYTADAIRLWMGDFSGIRNVHKFMARMGQCFSQSVDSIFVPMDERHVRTERDIKGGNNPVTSEPYCFSDGVGKISTLAAAKVCKKLGLSKIHSAYQIRYAGYKGVLCIDTNLRDVDIVFRDSMKKFDCPSSNKLEIVQVSLPISVQLNRPLITILEHLGVSGSTFLRMQQNMLQELTDILLDDDKAAEFLNTRVPNNLINFKDLRQSGITLTIEQFFRSLLFYLHRRGVVRIKKKAQLSIDPSEGRNMLGVLDETGILKYGQVFVKYTVDICEGKKNGKTEILKGKVLVTKNPCLQPGDVRLLEAVDVPQLHAIVDCVVFPKCGHRPHPSEMGGSDLDGDEYSVIWKRELVSPIKENYPPMNFPSPKPRALMHEITKDDMIRCLVGYVKNDTVGVVGTAHLIMADQEGLDSKNCFELARKFSLAVDFIKSGEPTSLSPTERPKSYPDFLEKDNHMETYKSKKILGKLYRMCNEFETVNEMVRCHYHDVETDDAHGWCPEWTRWAKRLASVKE